MLNGKQKRYLRSLAVNIKPIAQIGKDGLGENTYKNKEKVIEIAYKTVNDAFNTHELIKLSVLKSCDLSLNEICVEICARCHCELVQTIGKTIVLYKRAREPKLLND